MREKKTGKQARKNRLQVRVPGSEGGPIARIVHVRGGRVDGAHETHIPGGGGDGQASTAVATLAISQDAELMFFETFIAEGRPIVEREVVTREDLIERWAGSVLAATNDRIEDAEMHTIRAEAVIQIVVFIQQLLAQLGIDA